MRAYLAKLFDENQRQRGSGKLINGLLFLLIFTNVVMIVLESVASFEAQYRQELYYFELFSVAVFTLEYIFRVWSSVDISKYKVDGQPIKSRLRFILSPLAIIDLLAILPFYLAMFVSLDLRFLRILRLLRIFKLTRYSSAMKTLMSVFKDEMPALIAAYFIMFTIVILTSAGIYLLEHEVQPQHFGDIPSSMWWAVISLTTVGYGDVTPVTMAGKIFGGIISLVGISMVALPTGILASGFGNAFRRKRMEYERVMHQAMLDGNLTSREQEELDKIQKTLGVHDDDAKQIYKAAIYQALHKHGGAKCPHCGKTI